MAYVYKYNIDFYTEEGIFDLNKIVTNNKFENLVKKIYSRNIEDRYVEGIRLARLRKLFGKYHCFSLHKRIEDNKKPLKGDESSEKLVKIKDELFSCSYWVYDEEEGSIFSLIPKGAPNVYEINLIFNHFITLFNAINYYIDKVRIYREKINTIDGVIQEFKEINSFSIDFDLNEFEYSNVEDLVKTLKSDNNVDTLSSELGSLLDSNKQNITEAIKHNFDKFKTTYKFDKKNDVFKENKKHIGKLIRLLDFSNQRISEVVISGKDKKNGALSKSLKKTVFSSFPSTCTTEDLKNDQFDTVYNRIIFDIGGGEHFEQTSIHVK